MACGSRDVEVVIDELEGDPDLGYRYRMTCGGKSYDVALEFHVSGISIRINGEPYTPLDAHDLSWPTARHAAAERVRELWSADEVEQNR
jgi:hypothetical protein